MAAARSRRRRRCGAVLLALLAAASAVGFGGAALPPGLEDELYCPAERCRRPRQEVQPGFAGPRRFFFECVLEGALEAEAAPPQPEAWGVRLGEEAKAELLGRGFHQRECGGDAAAARAETAEAADDEGTCSFGSPAKVHAAFYLWYGTPQVDGRWMHWNHKVLPHWDKATDALHPKFDWRPPEEPHPPFYPSRGPYSSRDEAVLRAQFQDLAAAGVDSAMCSWWGRKDWQGRRDDADSGANTDELMPAVLEAARLSGVGVSFHLEPYKGRTAGTFLEDLRYIHEQYGSHPAVYKERGLPVFWMYDVSAQHSREDLADWRRALDSVRGTPLDGIFLCLWIGERFGSLDDAGFVEQGGFDGAYTYFAATGFTRGSTPKTWASAVKKMRSMGKVFVPGVGPGYNDTMIRPWNAHNTKPRRGGAYYDDMWRAAVDAEPSAISVTSYNEWGEGTQIEPSVPYTSPGGLPYSDYWPEEPDFYLQRTRKWADRFRAARHHCAA